MLRGGEGAEGRGGAGDLGLAVRERHERGLVGRRREVDALGEAVAEEASEALGVARKEKEQKVSEPNSETEEIASV